MIVFLDLAYQQLTSSGVMNASLHGEAGGLCLCLREQRTTTLTDVYVDDVTITYTPSPIVQQDSYYQFGLRYESFAREKAMPNRMKRFQGARAYR